MSTKTTVEKKPKGWVIYSLLFIITILSSIFTIYELTLLSTIETVLRYVVIGIIVFIDFILLFRIRRYLHPKKIKRHTFLLLFMLFYAVVCGIVGCLIHMVIKEASSLNKVYVTYTSNLIVSSSSSVQKPSDMKNLKIGILEDKKSIEGYVIPMNIVKENNLQDENELVTYGDYTSMIVDLYANDLDACFVTNGYTSLFSQIAGYENIQNDTRIVTSKSQKFKKANVSTEETASSGKNITEPFTLLLMGIDSTDEVLAKNAVANGDTLILITFNPKTLNATMLSIPRDSYVPIACWSNKAENKITHAAAYGNDCMIKTIENYFNINIDYYTKVNFKGLVKLVDALGGIEINVEQTLCTDNSNREEAVCIFPGKQTLNGEQALVYARNRKQLANGDFGRNYHQQQIIMALVNKVKEIKDATTFLNLLNTVSNSIDTNFTTKQILSFYNIAKDIIKKSMSNEEADLVNIDRLYLQGASQMIYDERAKMVLYNYVPNKNSRKDIIQAMNENLEKVGHTVIKKFNFSINYPFEKEVIGYGPYTSTSTYTLLPSFIGDTQAVTQSWCTKLGIRCTFVGTDGVVISQSYPASTRVDKIKDAVTFTLSKNKNEKEDTSKDKDDEDDDESDKKDKEDEKTEDTTDTSKEENKEDSSTTEKDNTTEDSDSTDTSEEPTE